MAEDQIKIGERIKRGNMEMEGRFKRVITDNENREERTSWTLKSIREANAERETWAEKGIEGLKALLMNALSPIANQGLN